MMLTVTIDVAGAGLEAEEPAVGMSAFTGIWSYNSDLSDEVSILGVSSAVGASLRGPHDNYDSHVADSSKIAALLKAIEREVETSRTLIIGQSEDALVFADDHGRLRPLIGVWTVAPEISDRTIETAARWDGSRIVRELSFGDGIRVVNVYRLIEHGQRLEIETRLETPLRDSVIRRVYQLRSY
jgi:hypothetical protein